MAALHAKADLEVILVKRSAKYPKATFGCDEILAGPWYFLAY